MAHVDYTLKGSLSDQVRDLERQLALAHQTIQKRDEIQQGAIDSLTRQLHEAMVRAINPPMIVQNPEGRAIYRDTDGAIFQEKVTWQHSFNLLNPEPVQTHDLYGRRWRRLMWKRDVAHQNFVLAVYVPEPR